MFISWELITSVLTVFGISSSDIADHRRTILFHELKILNLNENKSLDTYLRNNVISEGRRRELETYCIRIRLYLTQKEEYLPEEMLVFTSVASTNLIKTKVIVFNITYMIMKRGILQMKRDKE